MDQHNIAIAASSDTGQVSILRGQPAVLSAMRAAASLFERSEVPFCGRPPWLSGWYASTGARSAAVLVRRRGEVVGLACLALRQTGPLITVTLAGDGPSDYGRLPATDDDAASALADGVLDVLAGIRTPWRLRLAQLPVADPVARRLVDALPGARLEPGQASPAMRFRPDRTPEVHLAAKCRRAARRGRNRLATAGLTVRVDRVSEPAGVAGLLPDVVALHRDRDRALGRRSDLDPLPQRAFYVDMVGVLASRGVLDIWALRMDGVLGAYVVGVRDGRSYRTLDARMADRWQAASPGQILRTEMITELLTDPQLSELDWMRGELRHKMQDATHVVAAEQVLAESSPLVTSALHGWQSARSQLRDRVPAQARQWLRALH